MRRATLVLLVGLLTVAASPADPADSGPVLGPDGVLYWWQAGQTALEAIPLTEPPHVNDLAPVGRGDRLLVLGGAPPPAGRAIRRGKEGIAVVLAVGPRRPPVVSGTILFEGEGFRAAVAPDGRHAYVLAVLPGPGGSLAGGRSWVHAIDLEAGAAIATVALDHPPNAITIDREGRRVYVSLLGRILSFTTGPLAGSWHYRSPGTNRGLVFRPGSDLLVAVRGHEVALFDRRLIEARSIDERRRLDDDATGVIPLPIDAFDLVFSEDGRLAAALGRGGRVAFLDLDARRVLDAPEPPAPLDHAELFLPIRFPSGPGDLLLAAFPSRTVVSVPHPLPAAPPFAPAAVPSAAPVTSPAPSPTLVPTPTPPLVPAPAPAPRPEEPPPAPIQGPIDVLGGRITGERGLVEAVVIYGPGSIVTERARVTPGADGVWTFALPPAGTYRVVPIGSGGRPLRSSPNFQTVTVAGEGRRDLDFTILGLP
jgi:hypothetical protein